MADFPHPARQALRYVLLALAALIASALGESILQSPASLYVAFEPALYLREGDVLLALLAGVGLLGAVADHPARPRWLAAAARALLLSLLFIGLFQLFRRSLAASLSLAGFAKLGLIGLCLAAAVLTAWRLRLAAQWRLASACGITVVVMFALQPGMPSYVLSLLPSAKQRPAAQQSQPAEAALASTRRTVVVVLDEWDQEVSLAEGLFDTTAFRTLLAQSFMASQAMPAGPSTLSSIPSMLIGRRFGAISRGGAGYIVNSAGERFDASTPTLFSDLQARGHAQAAVGFYHDYCAVLPSTRSCHAEPVQFFPGWGASLMRAFKRQQDFDYPYSDFLRQWSSTYARLREASLSALADPRNTVVWLHLNVPHPPVALAGVAPRSLREDYQANLAELTRLIASLQQAIQQAGGDSAMVLTSDHWLREKELWTAIYERQRGPGAGTAGKTLSQHVPFIVWFSDATPGSGQVHGEAISTTALRALVPAMVERKIQSPADVAAFFRGRDADPTTRFKSSDSAAVH